MSNLILNSLVSAVIAGSATENDAMAEFLAMFKAKAAKAKAKNEFEAALAVAKTKQQKQRKPRRVKVAAPAPAPAYVAPSHMAIAKNGLSSGQLARIQRISLQFAEWCAAETAKRTDGSKCSAGLSRWQSAVDTDGHAHKVAADGKGKGADMLYLTAKDYVLNGVKHDRHTFMAEHRFSPSSLHCSKIERFLKSEFFKG